MSSYEYNHAMARAKTSGHIFGVTWDGSSSTSLTRTDDAVDFPDPVPYVSGAASYSSPFDDIMPWSGMVKVTDATVGTLVEIPKFWYKLTKNGSALSIQIANKETDGFSVAPAHMNRGDGNGERDVVYIGRYHCGATAYKSVSGQNPKVSITRSTARTQIHNLGSTYWSMDFAMRFTIWLLYIVEFADWNSQTKIGYGCGNNSSVQAMGASDSMPYHTGTMQSSRTTYGVSVQYRWIEGLWDNCLDWMDGCYYISGMKVILNPSNFSDSANGTNIGTPINGYPSSLSLSTAVFPMFYPTTASGSDSTYIPDYWGYNSSYPSLYAGGDYSQNLYSGLFYLNFNGSSYSSANIGCRLMKLP